MALRQGVAVLARRLPAAWGGDSEAAMERGTLASVVRSLVRDDD